MSRARLLAIVVLFIPFALYSQTRHSWDGSGIAPNSSFRTLNIFANIIFDVDPAMDPVEDSPYWQKITNPALEGVNVKGTEPSYLLEYMDTEYVPGHTHGTITRIFGESSFDSLQITGDFVVVNLLQSRMIRRFGNGSIFSFSNILKMCLEMINETGGLKTLYGHNRKSDYAYQGKELYYSILCIRNTSAALGGKNVGGGVGNFMRETIVIEGDTCKFSGKGAIQCVGGGNFGVNPSGVVTHEIAHALFGGNNFHIGGGNHRGSSETMPFMTIQGGYALLGVAHSGLVSCNGYERWRMHWKHPNAPAYISAHNAQNKVFVPSDICKEDGVKTFVLRDFVTSGDAIRIRLPYKDSSTTPNQYIWLEFHNVGKNGKLDFFQYSNSSCLAAGTAGIYAYYQIGRDQLEGTSSQVWDNQNRDNLRVISNEGFWDYTRYMMPRDTNFVCTQWTWVPDYYVPEYPNAFCGYQDQEMFIVPKPEDVDLENTMDSVFSNGKFVKMKKVIREYTMYNKVKNGAAITNSISFMGDNLDAFSSHRKINMGTNPSTCNAKTYYSYNRSSGGGQMLKFDKNTDLNNSATYLTGLSIEMTPQNGGDSWLVKIRWDDYDVTEDARWTGRIVLKGTEQVNLTRGYGITLAQNRTPAQRFRDAESGYFAEPTKLTCESGSVFAQEPQSSVILTEKSRFVVDSGAVYILGDDARLVVKDKSEFHIAPGAEFMSSPSSKIVVGSKSTLYVPDVEKLRSSVRVTVRPGGKLISISN